MTLADFMALKGVSRTDMAAMLGVSPEAVRLWLIGERTPSRDKMQAIAKLSAGAVMPNDFFLSSPREEAKQ